MLFILFLIFFFLSVFFSNLLTCKSSFSYFSSEIVLSGFSSGNIFLYVGSSWLETSSKRESVFASSLEVLLLKLTLWFIIFFLSLRGDYFFAVIELKLLILLLLLSMNNSFNPSWSGRVQLKFYILPLTLSFLPLLYRYFSSFHLSSLFSFD